jgi:DNA-directed RNA polymerase sigma subunit (sigma70/sigma32)
MSHGALMDSSLPPPVEDRHCYTYAEIGAEMGISGERVRQIEHRALRKLARVHRFRKLLTEMLEP